MVLAAEQAPQAPQNDEPFMENEMDPQQLSSYLLRLDERLEDPQLQQQPTLPEGTALLSASGAVWLTNDPKNNMESNSESSDVMNENRILDSDLVHEWVTQVSELFLQQTAQIPNPHYPQQQPPPPESVSATVSSDDTRSLQVTDALANVNANGGGNNNSTASVTPVPLNVDLTCAGYNAHAGFDCTCRRILRFDVLAECTIADSLCNTDNSSCFIQSFAVILDGMAAMGRPTIPASRMTTCTQQYDLKRPVGFGLGDDDEMNSTTTLGGGGLGGGPSPPDGFVEDDPTDDMTNDMEDNTTGNSTGALGDNDEYEMSHTTCVEIQPRIAGFFNESIRCGASVDGRLCRGCSQCTASSTSQGHSDPLLAGNTTITIDCCNVWKDGRQTCGYVQPNTGFVLPYFDPPGTHKGCNGCGASMTLATGTLLLSFVALVWGTWTV